MRADQQSVNLDPATIDATVLDPAQVEILHALLAPEQTESSGAPQTRIDIVTSTQSQLGALSDSLEFKVDLLADNVHRLEQYRQGAERIADRILAAGAERLEERDQERKAATGSGQVDSIDVLRALSRAAKPGS